VRKILRERSRNSNREVWESPSVYGGEDVKVRDFQKINYSFSRIIIILGVWEVGIDGCPLLPIL
jgi:hypothetical protein